MQIAISNKTVNKQPIIALSILWVGGIILLGYLFFIFDNSIAAVSSLNVDSSNTSPGTQKKDETDKNKNAANNATANDAFVFVNVNKKHFLTKFVSTMPETDLSDTAKKNIPTLSSSGVERVSKVIKINPTKKSSDFSIKPAPEL